MFTWEDAFRIAVLVVASVGGVGAIIVALVKFLAGTVADRLAERSRRDTETALAEMRGRLDQGLSRLNAALQHQNFVRQRLAEIELNGIHACWRAAANLQHLINGLRPVDCGTDREALQSRLNATTSAHNTLLALYGKYDPFLDAGVRTILAEVLRLARLEMSQTSRDIFSSRWWDQGLENREALEVQITALRAAVQLRIVALLELADASPDRLANR